MVKFLTKIVQFSGRKPYNVPKLNAQHFCTYQNPQCERMECRVAAHIIAGRFPLNFSQFLLTAYQPLSDRERKEVMNIKNLYFTYLLQKFHDERTLKKDDDSTSNSDLFSNLDGTDYSVFCDIGSAFAECYLIDVPIPVNEILASCFIVENNDIKLNMYWLECIYLFRANDDSLHVQLDQLDTNKKLASASSNSGSSKCTQAELDELCAFTTSLMKNDTEGKIIRLASIGKSKDSKNSATLKCTEEEWEEIRVIESLFKEKMFDKMSASATASATTSLKLNGNISDKIFSKSVVTADETVKTASTTTTMTTKSPPKMTKTTTTRTCEATKARITTTTTKTKTSEKIKISMSTKCTGQDFCDAHKPTTAEKEEMIDAVALAVKQTLNK